MVKQPLASSVLLASKPAAEALSKQLLAATGPSGKPVAKRVETETGFKLLCMMQLAEGGEWKPCTFFEFAQRGPGPIIHYDPRLVNLKEPQANFG